ncbi:dolichyl-phosphate beta-glucosyltransferase [Coemansia sp. RSA 1285]|nr:dolichyl-phosphate beta-glucosyltransferase [Coemansia sp. RSA 1285]
MHVERFIFDIEILLLARYLRIAVFEVPVNWHEVAGSKMSIVRDSIQMALDLLAVRLNYMLGLWKVVDKEDART